MFNKSCQWLDSNPGPLVTEATALPTAPQPLPIENILAVRQNLFSFEPTNDRMNVEWVSDSYHCSQEEVDTKTKKGA